MDVRLRFILTEPMVYYCTFAPVQLQGLLPLPYTILNKRTEELYQKTICRAVTSSHTDDSCNCQAIHLQRDDIKLYCIVTHRGTALDLTRNST